MRCSYCAFCSLDGGHASEIPFYTERLLEELRTAVDHRSRPFETVFVGGGNPGMLSTSDLERIIATATSLGTPGEASLEMNPESFTDDVFPLFGRGFSRLSLGLQSMDKRHLHALGRNASKEDNLHAIELAKKLRGEFGTQISADLMTCIPNQTVADALHDIDETVSLLEPDHISLYSLTVEEGTVLSERIRGGSVSVPDEDLQAEMLESCWDRLEHHGYSQYEISNFARREQNRCRHNERYWRLAEYIGLGPSAAGTVRIGDRMVRITAGSDVHAYAASPAFATYECEILDRDAEMTECLMVGLRTARGIDKREWGERFDRDFDALFGPAVASLPGESRIWCNNTEKSFGLTRRGFMLLDAIVLHLSRSIG